MMNVQNKQCYVAPLVEPIHLPSPLRLLVSISVEAGIEDWEEGEEL